MSVPASTARKHDWPGLRQFAVFMENRVGQLNDIFGRFHAEAIQVVALSVIDSADCAIVRLVLSPCESAREVLRVAGLAWSESDLIAVELPELSHPLGAICAPLLEAEINIHYAYPLLARPHGRPVIAFHVDDHALGCRVLDHKGLTLLSQSDIES